ncbi:protein-glutamine glutaminase family protein [Legionella worsleiensis]|uniref:Protein glutaminase domain-containing protein n=1 Tax=Legionella worsleiensis TaxID=45076 RepID=A0A0W1A6T5_9GAMM|nr:protein-glutamine glutaminase family protein [Legionella worsleiensis]KTD76984.1 hypothetical protein Lwor_2209 [Legionella worsleiensis]STY33344.1 Uncharacterised protein [Legionella worsleiensis]
MKILFSLLMLFPFFVFSGSSDLLVSSKRAPHESFSQAIKRVEASIPDSQRKSLLARETPVSKKVPVQQMDFSTVPVVVTYEEMMNLFQLIRDTRYLYVDDKPDFARRISWLYPDDGCFARAALSAFKIEQDYWVKPAKIFVFGDLVLQTSFAPDGFVSWWYHVSTAVNYMGSIYVFDPALNPERPLLVEEWFSKMGDHRELDGVICNSYTYAPFDNCGQITKVNEERAVKDEAGYLKREWNRMSVLGFDPEVLLGNNPPWRGMLTQ